MKHCIFFLAVMAPLVLVSGHRDNRDGLRARRALRL